MRFLSATLPQTAFALSLIALSQSATAQNAELHAYAPAHQVSGVVHVWGSPQMGDLLKRYEEGFHKVQPAVQFEDDLKSTITAVAGVYTGRADIGLLGREIWPTELQAFASIEGHSPLVIDVATGSFDVPKATFALMVFVPRANPIATLSTTQLERLFANTDHPVRTWGDLGLTGAWAARPVDLYGFSVDNDKSQIFSQLIFKPGERWNSSLLEFANGTGPNGADAGELIIHAVAADPDGIGISNIHYATPDVRALPLSTPDHLAPIAPTRQTVAARLYPLTRAVYVIANAEAGHPPQPATVEFLRFVLSEQGRQAVVQEGNYIPLTPEVAAPQLRKLAAFP